MPRPNFLRNWFLIRRDLTLSRGLFLSVLSFLLPIFLWCLVSYVPWLWHPDVKLELSAEREGVATVFTEGDHISPLFFKEFEATVRKDNQNLIEARKASAVLQGARRDNQRLLRQLVPIAVRNKWLTEDERQNDAKIYQVWKDLALGNKTSVTPLLSAENLDIIRKNWTSLSAHSDTFSFKTLPDEPLLKLIPQGRPANPIYLPAPHEVIKAGYRDFTAQVPEGSLTMGERYTKSLRVIFLGFIWACVIGIPLGILCGIFDFFSKLIEPFVDFFRYLPAPTFSTLLVAVLLAGDAPKIALVFIGTVFQMILVISKTTRLLDPSLLEAAQTLGAKPTQILRHVVIPGILPNLYNDLRILLGWAWTWLVIAELIGMKSGLTEFIETQGRFRNFDRVFPVIILIGITGFLSDQFLAWLHGLFFPWAGKPGRGLKLIVCFITWPFRMIRKSASPPLN